MIRSMATAGTRLARLLAGDNLEALLLGLGVRARVVKRAVSHENTGKLNKSGPRRGFRWRGRAKHRSTQHSAAL
jgi:hypothetical protein